jgi:hypothetical protein
VKESLPLKEDAARRAKRRRFWSVLLLCLGLGTLALAVMGVEFILFIALIFCDDPEFCSRGNGPAIIFSWMVGIPIVLVICCVIGFIVWRKWKRKRASDSNDQALTVKVDESV